MGPMRILLWHGYLLGGTGSNVYTRALAREWSRAGHDVTVFAQEAHPELYDLGGAQVVRPDIGGLLPVFVLDAYEGVEVKLVQDLTAEERERYVAANAEALREHLPADLVFANHVILGGPVAAASGARFAVKAHGSELEYAMRGNERAVGVGEGVARASRGGLRRLGAHPRGARRGRRTRGPSPRRSAGSRHRPVHATSARRGAPQSCSPRAAPIRRTPATRTSASRTRGTPTGWRRSSRATSRRFCTSASSCATRASTSSSRRSATSTRAPSSSGSGTTATSWKRWPRPARCSPERSSTGTSRSWSRSPT